MLIRSYKELIRLKTFDERYKYLRLSGIVGKNTFGNDRYLNQALYRSDEWLKTRDKIIIRDDARDLGVEGYELECNIYVHHINPITIEDIEQRRYDLIFNPNFLICTSYNTHQAIHFGTADLLPQIPIERRPNDTAPWRL